MEDLRGVDPDIIALLRDAAMAEKSVTHLMALLLLTHDPDSENSFGFFKVMHNFEDAFGWDIAQMAALRTWSLFGANGWPDETINARYAPLLEAWRKNPTTYPVIDEFADLHLNCPPLSDAETKEVMKILEIDWAESSGYSPRQLANEKLAE